MSHDKLVAYIRRGVHKGFSTDYLRDTLVKNGHEPKAVEHAIAHATGGPQKEAARQRLKVMLGALSIIAVVLLAVLILSYSNQQKEIQLLSSQVQLTQEAARLYMDELDRLEEEISSRESIIQQRLRDLRAQDDSAEFQDLLSEVESLHKAIQEERDETRDALWELFNQIIERRANEGPEPLLVMSTEKDE